MNLFPRGELPWPSHLMMAEVPQQRLAPTATLLVAKGRHTQTWQRYRQRHSAGVSQFGPAVGTFPKDLLKAPGNNNSNKKLNAQQDTLKSR